MPKIERYKWDAANYFKNSSEQQRWARELLEKIEFSKHAKVLDIGCGDGKITAEIAGLVPNGSVLGIDSSKEMVNFAKEQFPKKIFPNLTFMYGDAMDLNFDNEFDTVVSFACLHWVINNLKVLERISRSLKPHGQVLLQFVGRGDASVMTVTQQVIATPKWHSYFEDFPFPWGMYGPDEYQTWLAQVSLKAKRVELSSKDVIYSGKVGLKGWVQTTWHPYLSRVPQYLHQTLIDDIVDWFVEYYPFDNSGLVHVPIAKLEVAAEKI